MGSYSSVISRRIVTLLRRQLHESRYLSRHATLLHESRNTLCDDSKDAGRRPVRRLSGLGEKRCDILLVNINTTFLQLAICSFCFQEMVLSIIPSFSNMIDYSAMKNSIIPRIKSLCLQTTSLSVSEKI